MKKYTKKMVAAILTAGVVLTALTGCKGQEKVDGTQVVASVDGTEIPMGVASFIARYQQAGTEAMYQQMMGAYGNSGQDLAIWDGDMEDGTSYGEKAKKQVEDMLNEMYVLEKHAKDFGVEVTEEEKAAIKKAAEGYMTANSQETLDRIGAGQEDIEKVLELYTIQSKMFAPMVEKVDTNITDEEANQSKVTMVTVPSTGGNDAQGNPIELTEEEKAAKKDTAEKVLEKVKAAGSKGDMSALAKEVDENLSASIRTYTTASAKDEAVLDAAILDAAAGLKDGQVYDGVIETANGYVVLRMENVFDAEATESKKGSILNTRKQELYNATLDEWVKAAPIEMVESVWKQITITDAESFLMKAAAPENVAE